MSCAAPRLRWGRALVLTMALLLVAPAQAHAPSTGLGAAIDGVAWLLETPSDLLVATALVVLQQQQPAPIQRPTWLLSLSMPLAWTAAALIAQALPLELLLAPLLSAWTLAIALLAALAIRLPPLWLLALQLCSGLGFGMVSGARLSDHAGAAPVLVGAGLALLVWRLGLRAVLPLLRGPWGAIALRIGGSWIAAASLLMLGWQLRHPQ